jgi:hypothetical protein
MPFNCPGHESFRKGLSGCGIDTANAPVHTVFYLPFTASDLGMPSATSTVVRLITVVSPCGQEEGIYCPDLAKPAHSTGEHACGTTGCIFRAAILALQPMELKPTLVAPSIEFSTSLPVSAISKKSYASSSPSDSVHGRSGITISEACRIFCPPETSLHFMRSCVSGEVHQCPVCS